MRVLAAVTTRTGHTELATTVPTTVHFSHDFILDLVMNLMTLT